MRNGIRRLNAGTSNLFLRKPASCCHPASWILAQPRRHEQNVKTSLLQEARRSQFLQKMLLCNLGAVRQPSRLSPRITQNLGFRNENLLMQPEKWCLLRASVGTLVSTTAPTCRVSTHGTLPAIAWLMYWVVETFGNNTTKTVEI